MNFEHGEGGENAVSGSNAIADGMMCDGFPAAAAVEFAEAAQRQRQQHPPPRMPMLPLLQREPEAEQVQPQGLPDYDSLADSMLSDGFDATTTIGFVKAVQRQRRDEGIDWAAPQSSENKESHDSPDQVSVGTVKLAPLARAGDWALSDIFERHPPETAGILATFEWPIANIEALARLFSLLPKGRWALVGGRTLSLPVSAPFRKFTGVRGFLACGARVGVSLLRREPYDHAARLR